MSEITITKVNEVYAKIECEKHIAKEISEYFTFFVPGYTFVPAYRNKIWDGKIRLFDSRNSQLQNFSHFYPPLERVSKLKFKFRYHNGNLVNFSNNDFSFTLQFDCYRDEIARELKLRIPGQYRM